MPRLTDVILTTHHLTRGQIKKSIMKIDFDHWKGSQLGDEMSSILIEKRMLQIMETLKPEFSKDGNQYCFLYGTLPNDCIIGFGETAFKAMEDFCNNFYTEKAIKNNALQKEGK